MIEARNLCKSYRRQPVLRDVSFTLGKGRVLGILGPNGAGKTTLIRILALIAGADGGTLTVDGLSAFAEAERLRPRIGYVPQDVALFEDLTVRENLLCWSARRGREARRQADRLAGALDLGEFTSKKVSALSGGMKRRTNLAVALLDDPDILILDEPLVGVDIEQRRQLLGHLKALAGQGVTQLMASHHVDELLPLADEILIMKEGEVRFYGSVDALRERCAARAPGTTPDEIVMEILDTGNGKEASS
jgi:ABC-2 type transport system ATP-binding protein